jgi:hypothetical protein
MTSDYFSGVVKWGRPTKVYGDGEEIVIEGGDRVAFKVGDLSDDEHVIVGVENVTIRCDRDEGSWLLSLTENPDPDVHREMRGERDDGLPSDTSVIEIPHYVLPSSVGDVFGSKEVDE